MASGSEQRPRDIYVTADSRGSGKIPNIISFEPAVTAVEIAIAIVTQIGSDLGCPRNQVEFERCRRESWTATLHQILASIGRDRQMLAVYGNKGGGQQRPGPSVSRRPQEKDFATTEFLFDHVWFDDANRMALAAEFELSRYAYHVLDDFRKLLYAKCPVKLCIYSDHPGTREVIGSIERELSDHGTYVAGEHYIIIRLCNWSTQQLEAYHVCPAGTSPVRLHQVFSQRWTQS